MLARGRGDRRVAPLLLVPLVALVVAACTSTPEAGLPPTEEATDEPTETETEPATEEATDAATEETEEPVDTTDPTEEATDAGDDDAVGEAVLEDGRHPVFLAELDEADRTVTFDLIQFLTGQEAVDAYAEDVPEDPDPGPPNDYWIRNESSDLRTLPIADDVAVSVIRLGESSGAEGMPWTFEELPAHLAEQVGAPDGQLGWSPFWLTVEDGVVVAIEEQYLP